MNFQDLNNLIETFETSEWSLKKVPSSLLYGENNNLLKKIENLYDNSIEESNSSFLLFNKKEDRFVMSDTSLEKITNLNFVSEAKGDVLIIGLGIGLIIFPLLSKVDVSSITVIEKSEELVSQIKPFISSNDTYGKFSVEIGNAFNYETLKKYDYIYIDIWSNFNNDFKKEVEYLKSRFSNYLNTSGKINCWGEDFYHLIDF